MNGKPPENETYQRLLAGGFADWRLTVDGLVARLLPSLSRNSSIFPTAVRSRIRLAKKAGPLLPYLVVVFALFPLMIWTGLAMSPAISSVFPAMVNVLGGQQCARTIHFFVAIFLVLFLVVHIAMVCLAEEVWYFSALFIFHFLYR